MKKSLLGAILVFALIITPIDTKAASTCSYKEQAELNEIANHVKANYEIVDIFDGMTLNFENGTGIATEEESYIKGFKISLLNITDDIYVTVSNDYNSEVRTFYKKDTVDGVASFESKISDVFVNYQIEVHSNKYTCIGEVYSKISLRTPVFNPYSNLEVCENNSSFYYCQQFISSENISSNEFYERLGKFKVEKEDERKEEERSQTIVEKIKQFYIKNKLVIYAVIIVVIVSGVATTVILIKKRRSRVL